MEGSEDEDEANAHKNLHLINEGVAAAAAAGSVGVDGAAGEDDRMDVDLAGGPGIIVLDDTEGAGECLVFH